MSFVFHPDAELELNEAIEWYETREPGLGLDFATQVYAAIQRAQAFPLAWQEMDGNIRRALVHRFPCVPVRHLELETAIHLKRALH
ncbi:MAG: hypothetical protein ACYCZA_11005 [Thiobacillus sp.]